MNEIKQQGEIILYQPDESVRMEVRIEDETVWLNRQQLADLFERDVKTIGKHISNALVEELKDIPTVAKFATVQKEGDRVVTRQVEYYNLDMILSVGHRVKSKRGVEFRCWSNKVLKDYMLKGYAISQRIERLEKTVASHGAKIDFFVRTSLPPVEGIFFDGQIFDAYAFATNLIKSAKSSIVLIDNYVDENTLLMLSKCSSGVNAIIYTHKITSQLQLDLNRHNDQYPPINIRTCGKSHDRFLIIDNVEVYHIGASLKDLGKKLFAFSKMEMDANLILDALV